MKMKDEAKSGNSQSDHRPDQRDRFLQHTIIETGEANMTKEKKIQIILSIAKSTAPNALYEKGYVILPHQRSYR